MYFFQAVGGGPVKIGYSDNVAARHKQLETHYGCKLVLLSAIEGDLEDEAKIHEQFDHIRLSGGGRRGREPEQFAPTTELAEFIGSDHMLIAETVQLMIPVKPKPSQDEVRAWIDRRLFGMTKYVASYKGVTPAEVLNELLDLPIRKAFKQTMLEQEAEGFFGPKS